MSYLKVKFYFKSRLNFLLLIFFLKWCMLFMISYEFMKIVSNVSYHIILLKNRQTDVSDVSRTNLLDEKQSDHLPLILLWNKYQLTGSKVYNTIFERMTTGRCKVGASIHLICRISPYSPSTKGLFLAGTTCIFELLSPSHDNIQSRCEITTDKRRQNESAAIVFHMPDLHWEVSPDQTTGDNI